MSYLITTGLFTTLRTARVANEMYYLHTKLPIQSNLMGACLDRFN